MMMKDTKQLKEFNQTQEQIARFQDNASLIEKNEKLKNLKQDLEEKEATKDRIIEEVKNISKYGNYRSYNLTDNETKDDDILLVSVPGEPEKKRVNIGTLNNLVRQLNIIFASFDCPFSDTGLSDN